MNKCPYCKEEVSSDALFCNHCGKNMGEYEVEKDQEEKDFADQEQKETPEVNEDEGAEESSSEPVSPMPVEEESDLEDKEESPQEPVPEAQEKTATSTATATQTEANKKPSKSKGKNKNKLYIGLIAFIAVLGIGLYVLGSSLTSENRIIKNFEKAIEDGDTKELKSLLKSDDKKMEITEDGLKNFIALYESKPSELKQVIKKLRSEAKGERTLLTQYPVSLEKDGKKWLLFDNYTLVVSPVFFNVSTNYENTTIYVGEEEVITSDTDYFDAEIGPYMPGEYTIRAVHDTGFSKLDVEEEVAHSDPELSEYVDLRIDGSTVYFKFDDYSYSNLKSIDLYINGKETDHDLIKDNFVGPLLTDGSMNASFEAKFPWGTVKTDDVSIDHDEITVSLGQNEEFQEEIIDLIMDFNSEFIEFFTQLDIENVTTVSTGLAETLIEEVAPNIDSGYEFKGAFHGADFYLDSFHLSQNYDDIWFVEVDAITYYEEAYYEEGKEEDLEQIEEETRFVIAYDQSSKDWVVHGLDYPSWMDEDEMERFNIESPEVFTSIWNDDLDKKAKKDKEEKKAKEKDKDKEKKKDEDEDKKKDEDKDKKKDEDKDKKKDKKEDKD